MRRQRLDSRLPGAPTARRSRDLGHVVVDDRLDLVGLGGDQDLLGVEHVELDRGALLEAVPLETERLPPGAHAVASRLEPIARGDEVGPDLRDLALDVPVDRVESDLLLQEQEGGPSVPGHVADPARTEVNAGVDHEVPGEGQGSQRRTEEPGAPRVAERAVGPVELGVGRRRPGPHWPNAGRLELRVVAGTS